MPNANANPEKRFFIDLIIRDISLEDAILDLIDNAVDSLIRTKDIDFYRDFVNKEREEKQRLVLAEIKIHLSSRQFKIQDNCGGMTFESAKKDVFRFGHPDPRRRLSLSVFGIGMKRAIFKIGRHFEIDSKSNESGFSVQLDVDDWLKDETTDWKIPIQETPGEIDPSKTGTKITIRRLREEVATLIESQIFQNRLIKTIKQTYPFYVGKYVRIFVNEKEVEGEDLSFAESQHIRPAIETWKDGNVNAILICGFLPREKTKWTYENSGWYLVCNGRVIVHADKSWLTGWGYKNILPQFMPKNRGFLGIVFLKSDNPEELPWNTPKRGVNTDFPVYIRTLKRMIAAARLVIGKQNKMYDSNDTDEPREEYRDSVKELQTISATKQAAEMSAIGGSRFQSFSFDPRPKRLEMTSIQFKVKVEDLTRVKKRLGRVALSNKEVGERVFKYFLDRECSQ